MQEEDEGGREYDVRDDREAVRDCHKPLSRRTHAAAISVPLYAGHDRRLVDSAYRAFGPGCKALCLESVKA